MTEAYRWLWIEGLTPLFGAGVLYMALGVCLKIAGNPAKFAWGEAADALGWLYAGMLIAIQSAVRLFSVRAPNPYLAYGCVVAAVICCLLLIVAMLQRSGGTWTPPSSMKRAAAALAVLVLVLGYQAHAQH